MREDIAIFDKENKEVLNSLLDSLRKNVGEDSSYLMERRRDIYDMHFSSYDSFGKDHGYFYPRFRINEKQADFFLRAKVGNVFFNKEKATYKAKLFEFKQRNQTVWLLICRKNECKSELNKPIVYSNENRIYYIDDAWP